jgi:gliding motility-associated-like protein
MKKIFTILLLLSAFLFSKNAQADHVMGADIQWKCLGHDTFKIIFKFYRDCRGIPKSNTVSLQFSSDSCSNSYSGSLNCNRVSLVDITPVCTNSKPCVPANTMLSSIPYGIEEHRFEGTVYLGGSYANCCWYKFTFSECCRSGPIGTGHSWANFSTELWLNRCVTPCDNGPEFKNPPIAIKCAGQDVAYNHGVSDEDGDSLVYVKALPNGANYTSPWSVNYPLTCFPGNNASATPNPNANPPIGFYLDPQTGDMIFRPMQAQETVLKVKVQEWRKINGVYTLIGIATRDMQFIILANCTNKNPTLTAFNPFEACAGQQLCFTINTNDQDFVDTTRIFWDQAIPGATFTTNNGTVKRASGQFCWTPSENDASTLPYYFRATVEDDHCPLNGRATRAYAITVKPTPKDNRNYTKKACGQWLFEATPTSSYFNNASYKWYEPKLIGTGSPSVLYSNAQNTQYQFRIGGRYVVRSSITFNGCANTYYDTLNVDSMVVAFLPPDTFLCLGKSLTIHGTGKWGITPYRYLWSTNDTVSTISITPTRDTTINFRVIDHDTCISIDSIHIAIRPLPVIAPNNDNRICYGDIAEFDAVNSDTGMLYIWQKNGAYYSNTRAIQATDSGEYTVRIIDTMGCEAYDTVNLYVNKKVVIGPVNDVAICIGDTATLTATGADSYEWKELGTNVVIASTPALQVVPTSNKTYVIRGVVTYKGLSCEGYDTVDVIVKSKPTFAFPAFPKRCIDGIPVNLSCTVKYNNTPVAPTSLFWTCPSMPSAIVNGFQFDPMITAPNGGTFVIYATAEFNGCSATDSTTITINPLPVVTGGSDKTFCENFGTFFLDTVSIPFDLKYGVWSILSSNTNPNAVIKTANSPGYSYFFDPAAAGVGYHMLLYKYKDFVTGCENSDTVTYQVIPIPIVNPGALPDMCTSNGMVDLFTATGCTPPGGVWSGPGVTGGLFDPKVNTTSSPQTYTLKYQVAAIGCSDEDSITFTVYPLPPVKLDTIGTVCLNLGDITLNGKPSSGGNGVYSGNGVSGNIFNTKSAGVGTHKIKYHFKESTPPYCEREDSIVIDVQDEPVLSIEPVQTLCEDDINANGVQVKCNINAPFGVQWVADNPTGFTNSTATSTVYRPSAQELQNHKISFKVTSTGNGVCAPVVATLDASIYPTPKISFTGNILQGCKPLTVQFTSTSDAGAGAIYDWDFGDPASGPLNQSTDANPVHIYNDSGKFTVTVKVTSVHGCFNTASITNYIEVYPYPVAVFSADPVSTTIALPKIKFQNQSRGNEPMEFFWNYGDGSQIEKTTVRLTEHSYPVTDTGWYNVNLRVVSAEGCEDNLTNRIYIGPDITVFIPNIFSPDNSGPEGNETFKVVAGGIKAFELKIFDRWGEQLFTTIDRNAGWNGQYKQQPCQQDVYIYKVVVTAFDDSKHEYNGTVILLR